MRSMSCLLAKCCHAMDMRLLAQCVACRLRQAQNLTQARHAAELSTGKLPVPKDARPHCKSTFPAMKPTRIVTCMNQVCFKSILKPQTGLGQNRDKGWSIQKSSHPLYGKKYSTRSLPLGHLARDCRAANCLVHCRSKTHPHKL